jgi:hypothetical protein
MANRYWRGGSGSWNATNTTNWSATPGGAGGASVPTSADSVFFDRTGTYTVELNGIGGNIPTCLDLTVSAGNVTFTDAVGPAAIYIYGSFTLSSATSWNSTANLVFQSNGTSKTITTNGKTLGNTSITLNGSGGDVWTLGSAFSTGYTSSFTLSAGTLNTAGYSFYANTFNTNNQNVRSLVLGASAFLTTVWSITDATNLTFNAGTSTITHTAQSTNFDGAGLTYYNVSIVPTVNVFSATVTGANTFNNLSFGPALFASSNPYRIGFSDNQVITGTLDFGTSGDVTLRRTVSWSGTDGTTQITLTAGAITGTNIDLRNIVIAGAAAPFNASSLGWGDCGNNSGVTFPSPKTVYWNLAGIKNWYDVGWATSSGGTPAAGNFPLPQDTAVFDDTGSVTGTITLTGYNVGNLNMSARTSAMTLAVTSTALQCGDMTLGSGVTITGALYYYGKSGVATTITRNSATINSTLNINNSPIISLGDNFVVNAAVTFNSGTLSLGTYNFSCTTFTSGTSTPRTLAFGTGAINCTGTGTVWNASSVTNLTVSGTPVVNVTSVGSTGITISSGGAENQAISFNFTGGTYALTISAAVFKDLNFSGYSGVLVALTSNATIYGNLTLSSSMTITAASFGFTFSGSSGNKTVTTNGITVQIPFTFSGAGSTWKPVGALTLGTSKTLAVSAGTFDFDGYTISSGAFTISAGATVAFGSIGLYITGSGAVFSQSSTATVTGLRNVYLTYSGATATSVSAVSVTEANAVNYFITAGTYSFSIASLSGVRNLDFYNSGASTFTGVWANGSVSATIYGSLTLKSGMTSTGTGTFSFSATSGVKTITSAGVTHSAQFAFNGAGGTWQLQDALSTTSSSTSAINLTTGTFDANGYNVTVTGSVNISNANIRTLAIGSGTWTVGGAWTASTVTNLTVTGTGVISLNSASAKSFNGATFSYTNITLNQGGAGTLSIIGANTFKDITNSYAATGATTILLGATQTVSQFTGAGASGKVLTLNSSLAGTQRTLTLSGGGTVSTDYLNVKDIAFTPGPAANGTTPYVWYLGANSINSGNNIGGLFQAGGAGALKVYQITDTAATSWTVPSDWNSSSNTVHLIGGGGGGGGARGTSSSIRAAGGGGGGAGYRVVTNYSSSPGATITVAVGAGGTAGTTLGGTGGTGGTTSWASSSATGGSGGSTTATPSSAGGAGGTGTYTGGTGGPGGFTTASSTYAAGGGGGGSAGPNGNGGNGGGGNITGTIGSTAGGGGGGNGGGTAGATGVSGTGGAGGNNSSGTGGGASNTAGTFGGGGGGGLNAAGKTGGMGLEILGTVGSGGGSGGSAGSVVAGTAGVNYGAGGGGGSPSSSTTTAAGGAGGQGLIVIAYVPYNAPPAPANQSNFMALLDAA